MLPLRRIRLEPSKIRSTLTRLSSTSSTSITETASKSPATNESLASAEAQRTSQAPNRSGIWSRSQRPREQAMSGPRFEQMIISEQPQPYSAMELIHKQPVRWRKERVVSCDGGGGPLGHPRIFINLDKPMINECTYCGVPFALESHKEEIKSLTNNSYPLESTGDAAEAKEGYGQR